MVQKTDQNLKIIKKFKKDIKNEIKINKFILFGSRAKGTFSRYSDFDLIIVSPDFKGVPWYKRQIKFHLLWKEDYPLEILCYTPEEIKKRAANKTGIIPEALREGIAI